MQDNFDRCLALTLGFEGGYVDHPLDPGGATNMGITRATLAASRGAPVAKSEVMALSRAEAASIYRTRYWDAVSGDQLPPGIDGAVFDYAVNSGPARAIRELQRALGLDDDGVIGPLTRDALSACDRVAVIAALGARRLTFLEALKGWATFGRGWKRRVEEVGRAATAMAAAQPAPTPSSAPEVHPDEETVMNLIKPWLESRTLWSNAIGAASLALSIFGFPANLIDAGHLTDAILQVIAGGSFVASSVFRVLATKRLA